jgi:hypothetical protein
MPGSPSLMIRIQPSTNGRSAAKCASTRTPFGMHASQRRYAVSYLDDTLYVSKQHIVPGQPTEYDAWQT